jgi:prepilin-type N-terminal cleavage/methylation domain-containing protein
MAIVVFLRNRASEGSDSVRRSGFTLVELMVVLALALIVIVPLAGGIRTAGDATAAVWDVASALEFASVYARTNNTYVWVGFYEENMAVAPGVSGTGRIVISVVASGDGTQIVEPTGTGKTIDPSRLVQVGKLIKINNMHLADVPFPASSDPAGAADSWDARPSVQTKYVTYAIRETEPSKTAFPFTYPVGGIVPPQYTFLKTIEFTPEGEALLNTSYSLAPWIEVGLEPVHGGFRDAAGKNFAAVQIAGVSGTIKIYRP